MSRRYDVCIIGGGAAGLAAAASIDRKIRTCILEKNKILGRKILATGGGRCNLTNAGCEGVSATLDFFASLGLETVCDEQGRYFPYSGCAADVVKILEDAVRGNGCDILTERTVESIERIGQNGQISQVERNRQNEQSGEDAGRVPNSADGPRKAGFRIHISGAEGAEAIEAGAVILAAGGKAAPQFGTVGDGYRLAKSLGHQVSRLYPILTGIECGDLSDLQGIRARGKVSLLKDEEVLASEKGEIQFVKDGLSGICVFNLTPLIHAEEGERPADAFSRYELSLDLAPDFTQEQIDARAITFGILTERLARRVGIHEIKDWRLPVLGIKGWRSAQCTAGGVLLEEVDPSTMESRLASGLYVTGEILDIQGPCGGYNLQNAWETGRRAAAAVNAIF